MAGDAEIQILISLVDNMSMQLKNIEKTLTTSGKNIQKTAENTSTAFDKQMGSLLVLGQAAGRVEGIFDSYQNMQLRLENATDRVTNAQYTLADAQDNLNKLQESGTATMEQLADAQTKVDRATNNLEISQNRLTTTQNQVLGTYINIGVQTLSLIRDIPVLVTQIKLLTVAGLDFIATPLGGTMVAISIAIIAITDSMNTNKAAMEKHETAIQNLSDAQSKAADTAGMWKQAIKDVQAAMRGFLIPQTKEEAKALYDIEVAKNTVTEAMLVGNEDEIKSAREKVDRLTLEYDRDFGNKRSAGEAYLNYLSVEKQQEQGLNKQTVDFFINEYDKIPTYLKGEWTDKIQEAFDNMNEAAKKSVEEAVKVLSTPEARMIEAQKTGTQQEMIRTLAEEAKTETGYYYTPKSYEEAKKQPGIANTIVNALDDFANWTIGLFGGTKKVGDAVISKGRVIETDPNDTLYASKNGGMGTTIIIQGDNYGIDAEEIAASLASKIGNTIRL